MTLVKKTPKMTIKMKVKIVNSKEFQKGLKDEKKEHLKSFKGDMDVVMQIVKDHLKMDSKYYSKEQK